MMNRLVAAGIVGAGCLLLAGYAPGQPPVPPPDPAKATAPKLLEPPPKPPDIVVVPPPLDTGDPTQPSERMREILGHGRTTSGVLIKRPLIAIKGRVVVKDKPPAFLVEVGDQLQLIAAGSVIPGPGNTMLHVKEVTRSSVTIQVMPQNETIVLH